MTHATNKALPDHESDPAHTPGDGWVGEGGASYLGPATHTASGHDDPGAEDLEGEDAYAEDSEAGE